jgi:hypothetical protein
MPNSRPEEAVQSNINHADNVPMVPQPESEAANIPLPPSPEAGEMEIDDSEKDIQSAEKGTIQMMIALLITANIMLSLFQIFWIDPLQGSGGRMEGLGKPDTQIPEVGGSKQASFPFPFYSYVVYIHGSTMY